MNACASVFKREIKGYFSTPIAYVFLMIFLFFGGFLTFKSGFFWARQATLRMFFSNMPILFMFLVPAIAMRLWSEERRSNSIELLFTLPIETGQAVVGKFLAAWAVIGLGLALTFPIVITVYYLGSPDGGEIVAGYIASMFLAGGYLAIGSFFSALSRNQVIAFVLAAMACGFCLFAGSPNMMSYLSTFLPASMVSVVESMSFQSRFESMQRGVLELGDIFFFIVFIAGWIWGNIVVLEERKAA